MDAGRADDEFASESPRERAAAAYLRAVQAGERAAELRAGSARTSGDARAWAELARRRAGESRARSAIVHDEVAEILERRAASTEDPADGAALRASAQRHRDAARADRVPRQA